MKKKDLLKNAVEHIDIKAINSVEMIRAMKKMSFSARDLASAADIYDRMPVSYTHLTLPTIYSV